MATGYEDIDRLTTQKQTLLNEASKRQDDIVNRQTQMNVDSLERNKQDIDRDAIKTNRALYQQYRKATNPFGVQAENLASKGLSGSGYAETTQSRVYNTYQQNITNTLNNARDLKADIDFQINQARQTGNITLAQNQLELYKQKLQLLTEEYDLRNNREQFLYQKQQNALSQSNWEKEFAYQQSRDKIKDNQWQKEYELSKKAKASSSSSSASLILDDTSSGRDNIPKKKNGTEYSAQEILNNIKIIQGANISKPIQDGISGKTFKSVDELLNYYGYAGVND